MILAAAPAKDVSGVGSIGAALTGDCTGAVRYSPSGCSVSGGAGRGGRIIDMLTSVPSLIETGLLSSVIGCLGSGIITIQ